MNRHRFARSVLAVAVLGVMCTNDVAAAEGLEEIVVTAQRREENLQKVPISITAFSADAITQRGINGMGDIVSIVPNMNGFDSPDKRGSVSVSLRGVSSGSTNISFDPANAMYIDGVYLGKTLGSALDVAEIERIEVLRGPQGTLYGRNSTGGAVNFISKRPTGEIGGKLTGSVGNHNLRSARAYLDLPALGVENEGAGTLSASIGAQLRKRDALYRNTNRARDDFDNLDRRAGRLALLWQVRENISFDYSYDTSKIDEYQSLQYPVGVTPVNLAGVSRVTALNGYLSAANAALNSSAGPLAAAAAADPTFGRWYGSVQQARSALAGLGSEARPSHGASDVDGYATSKGDGHSLIAKWDLEDAGVFGDVTLKSISGYRTVEQKVLTDLDGFDNSIDPATGVGFVNDSTLGALYQLYAGQANPALGSAMRARTATVWNAADRFGAGYAVGMANVDYKQWSEELQMIGSTGQIDYVLGLYWFKDEGKTRGLSAYAAPVGGIGARNFDNETSAEAAFAQFTWRPAAFEDRLALTLGVRRTVEEKKVTYLFADAGNPLAPPPNVPVFDGVPVPTAVYGTRGSRSFSNNSGMINAAYQLTDDINVFAKYSTGYRSGGFNGDVFGNSFDEETIEQYEIGAKSDWWDHRLRLNVALFRYTYDDQQLAKINVDPDTGRTSTSIMNGGLAKRWGGELELVVVPVEDLLLGINYGYIHGDFDRFAPTCGSAECIDADRLAKRPNSAGNQFSLTVDYTFAHLDFGDLKGHLAAYWQDRSYTSALTTGTFTNSATHTAAVVAYDPTVLDERTLVNARLSLDRIAVGQGTMMVALWGKNIFNQDYNTMTINFATLGPITQLYGEPRTYGLDVTYEF